MWRGSKQTNRLLVLLAVGLPMILAACTSSSGNGPSSNSSSSGNGGAMSRIKSSGVLRDCVDPEFPPDIGKNKQGQIYGFAADLAKAMADNLKVKVQYVETNFDGIIPGLQSNKCDMAITSMTPRPARAQAVSFAKVYYPVGMALVVRSDETRSTIDDFNQSSVTMCVQQGTFDEVTYNKFFSKAKATLLQSGNDCLLQLASGKVIAAPTDSSVAHEYVKTHTGVKAVLDQGQLGIISAAPVVQYGDLLFKTWIDEFLADMINSGDYAILYKKDIGTDPNMTELRIERGQQ